MKISMKKILLLVCLGISLPSFAQNWSVGVLGGQTSFDQIDDFACFGEVLSNLALVPGADVCPNDNDGTALGINVGYKLNETLGFEVGYINLDEYESSITIGGHVNDGDISAKANALYAAGVGSLSLSNRIALTGRLGVYDLNLKIRANQHSLGGSSVDLDTSSVSASGLYAGASLDYALSDKVVAQLCVDKLEFDVVSFELSYNFNKYAFLI